MSTDDKVKDAQRHSTLNVLDDLAAELDLGFIEETFEVAGKLWTLRTLDDKEQGWATTYMSTINLASMVQSQRAPIMAIGIRAVGSYQDGKPVMQTVEDLFMREWEKQQKGDDLAEARKILDRQSKYMRQFFFAEKMLEWLSARPSNSNLLSGLWEKWDLLMERSKKAREAMGKSLPEGGA